MKYTVSLLLFDKFYWKFEEVVTFQKFCINFKGLKNFKVLLLV
jgi:hypothetical protein